MAETTEEKTRGHANGQPVTGKIIPPGPRNSSARPADPPCEDCEPAGRGGASLGLGLVVCSVAGALLYIGLDLVTGGALTRRMGRAAEPEGEE